MENFKSGAIIKRDYRNITHKDRDKFLGSATPRPETYEVDKEWLERLSQKYIPACGSHAGSHFKMFLDFIFDGIKRRLSPIFLWRASKLIDGLPPSQGTTLEAIMKALTKNGVCDWDLLPTDFTLDENTQAYTPLTQEQLDNAQPKIIKSFAITYYPTDEQIKDIIWKDKVAILLIRFDGNWWKNEVLETNGPLTYGHFVCSYGYDKDYKLIVDSSDDVFPYKKLGKDFKVVAIGSAIDMPDEEVKRLVKNRSILQKVVELYRQMKDLLKK